MRAGILLLVCLVAACGDDPAARPAPRVTHEDFERSAFVRKYPPLERSGAARYAFADPSEPARRVLVQFAPPAGDVKSIVVTWHGDGAAPAWSSVKKQFHADLLEATFWDVDYGELSVFVVEHGAKAYAAADAMPRMRLGPVHAYAGSAGSTLVVGLER
jgi:hypothetical protein